MPPANQTQYRSRLMRSLTWGVEKVKKTSWALMAAKCGFNVIVLDGDGDGSIVLEQLAYHPQDNPGGLKPEDIARIHIVDLKEQVGETIFLPFVRKFLLPNARFTWDETAKKDITFNPNPKHSHYKFDLSKLTPNDVVVLDSWKALAESTVFKYADIKDLDLSEPPTDKKDADFGRNMFGYASNSLNYILGRLKALPCHLIVIGHATVYEKLDPQTQKVIEQRTQIISSSGPHAKGVGAAFHDLFYLERLSSTTITIDTSGDKQRMGGSRLFAPMKVQWHELLPEKVFAKLGVVATGEPCRGLQWFAPGEEVPIGLSATSVLKPLSVQVGNGSSPKPEGGNANQPASPPVIAPKGLAAIRGFGPKT